MEISITIKADMHRKGKLTFWQSMPSLWRGQAGWLQTPLPPGSGGSRDPGHGHTLKSENTPAFKKRPTVLNSAPTSKEGALQLLSAPSGKFWQQTAIRTVFAMSISRRATFPDLSYEHHVHVLSSADVARRLMLITKRGKWQFAVKTCR